MDTTKAPHRFTHREVAEEVGRILGRPVDPGYIGQVRNGSRWSRRLSPLIAQAEGSLASRMMAA